MLNVLINSSGHTQMRVREFVLGFQEKQKIITKLTECETSQKTAAMNFAAVVFFNKTGPFP